MSDYVAEKGNSFFGVVKDGREELFYKNCGMGYVCELETIAISFLFWSHNLCLVVESTINSYG
jgi:hypothetical protein